MCNRNNLNGPGLGGKLESLNVGLRTFITANLFANGCKKTLMDTRGLGKIGNFAYAAIAKLLDGSFVSSAYVVDRLGNGFKLR